MLGNKPTIALRGRTGEKKMKKLAIGNVATVPECKVTGAQSEKVKVLEVFDWGYLVISLSDVNGEIGEFTINLDLETVYVC